MTLVEIAAVSSGIVVPVFTLNYFVTRATIRTIVNEELSIFKDKLNTPAGYRRSESCDILMKGVNGRIKHIENKLDQIGEQV